MQLSKILQQVCKDQSMSLAKLAKASGVPKATIHGWMTGRKAMDLNQLKKVAVALKISIHELVFGVPDPYEKKSEEYLKELFSGDVRVTVHRIERKHKT